MVKKIIIIFIVLATFSNIGVALAENTIQDPAPNGLVPCGQSVRDASGNVTVPNPCNFEKFLELIVRIYKWLLYIVGPIAAASIAYAGILYAFYSTNDSKRKQAHDIITMAVFGLGIALAGYLIITQLFYLLVDDEAEKKFNEDPRVRQIINP